MFSVIKFLRVSWRRFLTVCACGCVLIAMATYFFLSIDAPVEVIAAYAILVHIVAMMQILNPGAGISVDGRRLRWHSPARRPTRRH